MESQAEPGLFPEVFHDLLVADGFFLKKLVVVHIDGGSALKQFPEKNLGPGRRGWPPDGFPVAWDRRGTDEFERAMWI